VTGAVLNGSVSRSPLVCWLVEIRFGGCRAGPSRREPGQSSQCATEIVRTSDGDKPTRSNDLRRLRHRLRLSRESPLVWRSYRGKKPRYPKWDLTWRESPSPLWKSAKRDDAVMRRKRLMVVYIDRTRRLSG